MTKSQEDRRILMREYSLKIKKLESRISDKNITSRDNIFCTGNDASIFYRIDELRKELKKELTFLESMFKTQLTN